MVRVPIFATISGKLLIARCIIPEDANMKPKNLTALLSLVGSLYAAPNSNPRTEEPWLFLSKNKTEAMIYMDVLKKHQKREGGDTSSIFTASEIISKPTASSGDSRQKLFQLEATLQSVRRIPGIEKEKEYVGVQKYLTRMYIAYLKSENASIAKRGIAKLGEEATSNAIDRTMEKEIRKELASTSWRDKYPLLSTLGLSASDKKEILALRDATPIMRAHAGDVDALEHILEGYQKEKSLIEKNGIVEALTVISNEKAASVIFMDLFYPVKKVDSPSSYHSLHFRQKILLLLRQTYPQEPIFKNELIDKPFVPQDTATIRKYLEGVGRWGVAKYGYYPNDSLSKPFIAFPEKRFQN